MATKKSSSKSAPAARSTKAVKPAKTPKAPAKARKTANARPKKFQPYHPAIGVVLLFIAAIIFSFLLGGLILEFPDKTSKNPDAPRFAKEYTSVEKSNVFHYLSAEKTVKLLESGTGVVFLGYPECPWCQAYAPMLNEVAKAYDVKVYYYNTYDDWQNNTPEYQKITELLGDYLQFDNVGNRHLYVPNVAFVVDGQIVANDWETSKDTLDAETPEAYWTEERIATWTKKMQTNFKTYLEAKLNSRQTTSAQSE
ncbi:hypothetical protein IJI72_00095 [Candidatus Saccharibacteria bacterium]|nr:hypothetical protein [Candidatus Saccharibacteria bacterium]